VTQSQYIGAFFGVLAIAAFTWQGLNLIAHPKEWLERYGRSTAPKHIRASRFIGWIFLLFVVLVLWQVIRGLA